MGLGNTLLSVLGIKGAVDTIKDGTSQSLENLKKVSKANKQTDNTADFEQVYMENLSGKLRFRQRMLDEGLNEVRYKRLNQKQYNYSIAVTLLGGLFLVYSLFMMFNGQIFISTLAITMILLVYIDTLRKASEIREQSFITIKEFFQEPALWLPTTKRKNDYFNIENEEQVNQLLDEIEKNRSN